MEGGGVKIKSIAISFTHNKLISLGLLLIGVFAYVIFKNISTSQDWVLNQTIEKQLQQTQNEFLRLKLMNIYPGGWEQVCFFGSYVGQQQVYQRTKIDIRDTPAEKWAGGENDFTFIFILPNKKLITQRFDATRTYSQSSDTGLKSIYCGNKNSTLVVNNLNYKQDDEAKYLITFYPNGVEK